VADFNSNLLWFIAGILAGYITNLSSPPIYNWLRLKIKGWLLRRSTKRKTSIMIGPSIIKERLTIGDLSINWIILQFAHYLPGRIRTSYENMEQPLHPDFARMKIERLRDRKKREAKGEMNLPHNGPMYKLERFDVGIREVMDGEEVPILQLSFRPTDYYSQLVTDLNIGDPTREKYAHSADITQRPISEFASILGVNINIITSDGYLIVTEKSNETHVAGGQLHTSVHENLLRPVDTDAKGAPEPFRCAVRGIQEEIGLVVSSGDVEYTAFGVYPDTCQYSLIGWIRVAETRQEVEDVRSQAIPKDKFENRRLIFIPCNPVSVANFVFEYSDRWSSIGESSVVLSLFQLGFSQKEITQAFRRKKDRM